MVAFAELARALDQAAATRGRNDRVRVLGELLKRLEPGEVRTAVNLMLGRGAGAKSGVSWAALSAAAQAAFGPGEVAWSGDGDTYVDAGEWVRRRAETSGRAGQDEVELRTVGEAFANVARARGRKEKERLLAELLRGVTPGEAAWLARNAVGEMRSNLRAISCAKANRWPQFVTGRKC